ncbi:MAG: STAS domain-containing protein [Candidatus Aureabacteria bacterium]|nr:STAS domain-containing protein [Candidatus Auribacterota bacterium]
MPMCSIKVEKIGFKIPIFIIRVTGSLDAYSFPEFEDKIRGILDKDGINLMFDFANLEYISSAGLGAMMGFAKIAREKKGDLVIFNPTPKINSIINILGLSKFIKVFDNEKTALSAFE